jgi:hypothetical protein
MPKTKLRVVIFQEGNWLCAHCLEYDFAMQARSLDEQTDDNRLIRPRGDYIGPGRRD